MKINKQLFEDVLSGKLKGTFVLRNGNTLDSKCLERTKSTKTCYPYALRNNSFLAPYTESGNWCSTEVAFPLDIIDFIPNTDMKENELTIEIPKGKIVNWEESKKQNKIVLKDKQLTYENICKKLFSEKSYFITNESTIHPTFEKKQIFSSNCAFTQHQLECILAKNKLATVAMYLNNGWKPSCDYDIFLLVKTQMGISAFEVANGSCASDCGSIWFKSREAALQAIEILGEETVKLALEPLGI